MSLLRPTLRALIAAAVVVGVAAAPAPAATPSDSERGEILTSSGKPPFAVNSHRRLDVRVNQGLTLGDASVAQSFAYDDRDNVLYTTQLELRRGAPKAGHLVVTKKDNKRTSITYGSMKLRNFGHGITMGVTNNPTSKAKPQNAYVWVECKPKKDAAGYAWGTKLCKTYFGGGHTITYDAKSGSFKTKNSRGAAVTHNVYVYNVAPPGATNVTGTVDKRHGLLLARYAYKGRFMFALYDLSKMKPHAPYTNGLLLTRAKPPTPNTTGQGYTFYGDWVYMLSGKARASEKSPDTTTVWAWNMRGSSPNAIRARTGLDESTLKNNKGFWEPEGMAVRLLPDGRARLRWGLAIGSSGHRKLAIFSRK